MPVLFNCKAHELPGDTDIFVPFCLQTPVNGLLTGKLIQPIIGIVIADQESFLNIMRDARKLILAGTVAVLLRLFFVAAIELDETVLIHPFYFHVIYLFKRQKCKRHLDRGGWIYE